MQVSLFSNYHFTLTYIQLVLKGGLNNIIFLSADLMTLLYSKIWPYSVPQLFFYKVAGLVGGRCVFNGTFPVQLIRKLKGSTGPLPSECRNWLKPAARWHYSKKNGSLKFQCQPKVANYNQKIINFFHLAIITATKQYF